MTEPETSDIDRRLREAFEDDATAAARIARIALSEDEARSRGLAQAVLADDEVSRNGVALDRSTGNAPRGRHWVAVAAGAAALLVASALVFWPARPLPEPAAEPAEPPMFSGVITDGALVVSMPDGSTSISWGAARDDRPPDGSGIVFMEGAIR